MLLRDLQNAGLREEAKGKIFGICGRLNAKNLLGGYVGYRRFMFMTMLDGAPFFLVEKDGSGAVVDGRAPPPTSSQDDNHMLMAGLRESCPDLARE